MICDYCGQDTDCKPVIHEMICEDCRRDIEGMQLE